MEGLVKMGPWGGRGGHERDIVVATGGAVVVVVPHRLESVVIRCEGAVDAISFTYAGIDDDGASSRSAGPWGGAGGRKHRVTFGDAEAVTEISGTYGPFGGHAAVVRSLTFVTSAGKRHGPFGEPREGTPFSVPLQNGARVVGFFGRSGSLLDALGVYVHP